MAEAGLPAKLREALDADSGVDLLRRMVACNSVTGLEASMAPLLADELRSLGINDVVVREFLPGRPNVWGVRRGSGQGRSVLLIGHTDTVHVRGWQERWAGTEREDPFGGAVVDGEMWGRGVTDLKGGLASCLQAVRILDRAEIPLAGTVTLAFVGDEESGEAGSGLSEGIKQFCEALDSGEVPKPDFAIYVEPTTLEVYPAQMGFMICDIVVTGRTSYVGMPEQGVDALKATHAILAGLWAHSKELEEGPSHDLIGRSFILVTSIEGGGYIAVPGECRLSLLRKLRPGESLDEAAAALERAALSGEIHPEIRVTFSYPASRNHRYGGTPVDGDPNHPAVRALSDVVGRIRPGSGRVTGAPFWSEAPFLTERGIPTVYFAPGDIRNCHTLEERLPLDEYRDGIVALSTFLAEYCN
jgi:acetylornithine deacetylase